MLNSKKTVDFVTITHDDLKSVFPNFNTRKDGNTSFKKGGGTIAWIDLNATCLKTKVNDIEVKVSNNTDGLLRLNKVYDHCPLGLIGTSTHTINKGTLTSTIIDLSKEYSKADKASFLKFFESLK